ncbi:hypothetical protein BD410DRAFT_433836 [Rickenella mellea]|uniref:Uncharacterized protein n=1 Tax=Rickenella mellea TaxID=50990 RepID=A0A4Y7PW26_9AGAM|nr:hypothetical protein BD410DRAFT_433836 [Rickenella mellea]
MGYYQDSWKAKEEANEIRQTQAKRQYEMPVGPESDISPKTMHQSYQPQNTHHTLEPETRVQPISSGASGANAGVLSGPAALQSNQQSRLHPNVFHPESSPFSTSPKYTLGWVIFNTAICTTPTADATCTATFLITTHRSLHGANELFWLNISRWTAFQTLCGFQPLCNVVSAQAVYLDIDYVAIHIAYVLECL